MALPESPSTGQSPETHTREQEEAQFLLADMEYMEDFAREYDQFTQVNSHLPPWELRCQRQAFADTYRRLIGVAPEQRELLRAELQSVNETGHRSVEAVIAAVRDRTVDAISRSVERHQ